MSTTISRDGSNLRRKAYIITGPTSGIGHATALELAKLGTVVLVGRDRQRLDGVKKTIDGEAATWIRISAGEYVKLSRSYLAQSIGAPEDQEIRI